MATAGKAEVKSYSPNRAIGTSAGGVERGSYDENPTPKSELRLVIFGKTGAGKSSTGNTILGHEGFPVQTESRAETTHCRKQQVKLNGKNVTIVDTPGVCDLDIVSMEILHEISKCLLFVKPGPHALLFVVNGNARFTEEEDAAYFALRKLFASHLNSYVIVVFTHFDEFECNEELFKKQLKEDGDVIGWAKTEGRKVADIRNILTDVRGKKVMISNTASKAIKDQQVLKLLKVIQDVADTNYNPYFQDPKTEAEAKLLERVIQDIKKEDFRRTIQEVWEKVKASPEVKEKGLLNALEPREAVNQSACAIL